MPSETSPKSEHHLLALITADANSETIVRRTGRLAKSLNCPWIALYVETIKPPGESEHAQIAQTLALAGELGAEVITTTGNDLVDGLLRVARQRNVTQIFVGKPPAPFWRVFRRDNVLRRLAQESGSVDIHLVSSARASISLGHRRWQLFNGPSWRQYLLAVAVVVAITAVTWLLGSHIRSPHAAGLIFLLGVVVLGCFVGRGPTLVAALMSALLWDYFILPPLYEFSINHFEDGLVFGMNFIVGLIMGQLTTRIRAHQEIESLGEERATALYLLTRDLSEATGFDQIVERSVHQMERTFHAQISMVLSGLAGHSRPFPHPASSFTPSEEGCQAVAWVLEHRQSAGKFTGNLPLTDAFYAPLGKKESIIGVVGVRFSQSTPPTVHQLNLLDAFLEQIVLALERQRLNEISEKAQVLAESERLTKTLLDSMSHEMRTPIAVIKSGVSNLAQIHKTDASDPHQAIIAALQDAGERLNRLVGNVLDITQLESGHVKPRLIQCDVSDLIHLAVTETERRLARHKVSVEITPGLPFVPLDFVLTGQALENLLSNAALHTPPGTAVKVSVRVEGEWLVIEVTDAGPGLRTDSIPRVFEKFYRGPEAPTGGTGLGLSLVKGFIEAQGGQVRVKNNAGGGAVFTILLPVGNMPVVLEPHT